MLIFWAGTIFFIMLAVIIILLPLSKWSGKKPWFLILSLGIIWLSGIYICYCYLGEPAKLATYYKPQQIKLRYEKKQLQPLLVELKKQQAKLQFSLVANSKDKQLWWQLGKIFRIQKEHAKALGAYYKAYQLDSNNTVFLADYIGEYLQVHKGALDENGKELVDKLLALDVDNPVAYNALAIDAYQNGNYKLAAKYWQKIAVKYKNEEFIEILLSKVRDKTCD